MPEPARRGLRDLCAHTAEDDGLDPRHERRADDRAKRAKQARKDEQLVALVARIADDLLRQSGPARVVHAETRGHGAHVVLYIAGPARDLDALAPRLRAELARRRNAKRTPSVTLRQAPGIPGAPDAAPAPSDPSA